MTEQEQNRTRGVVCEVIRREATPAVDRWRCGCVCHRIRGVGRVPVPIPSLWVPAVACDGWRNVKHPQEAEGRGGGMGEVLKGEGKVGRVNE